MPGLRAGSNVQRDVSRITMEMNQYFVYGFTAIVLLATTFCGGSQNCFFWLFWLQDCRQCTFYAGRQSRSTSADGGW